MSEHASEPTLLPPRLVLFDGVCAVCDAAVQWLLDHDPEGTLCYAPLQGSTAAGILERHPRLRDYDTLILVEQTPHGERVSTHSTAVLQMCSSLPAPWRLLTVFTWVPRLLRDTGYRTFAASRFRIFGRRERCRIPKPDEVERFYD